MPSIGMPSGSIITYIVIGVIALGLLRMAFKMFVRIQPTEVGLVLKRYGKELQSGIIALNGETGYQDRLLLSGFHFVTPFIETVKRYPLVQIETDEIGVVIAQVGMPLESGNRSGAYKPDFGDFENVADFINKGGQKGVQRKVLQPGSVAAIHPTAFLVLTSKRVYGLPVDTALAEKARSGELHADDFGLSSESLKRVTIETGKVGIVETLDGPALEADQVAGRIGGFTDIAAQEQQLEGAANENDAAARSSAESKRPLETITDEDKESAANSDDLTDASAAHRARLDALAQPLLETILQRQLDVHHSYQDFQAFIAAGGRMGVQHDVLSPGSYNLNPYLVRVSKADMLSVDQSQVAVIRSSVGLPARDVSGGSFRYGTLTLPGHRGLWACGLRTGLYPLNTTVYTALMVPTSIITLSWATASTAAEALDRDLTSIQGTSKDGFEFTLELQAQVHVPADQAPHLISLVGHMEQLVNGVLQPVVGAFFRDAMQSRTATEFIEQREQIRSAAEKTIREALSNYYVQTVGVFIQAVHYPEAIANVLRERQIATQQKVTYEQQEAAENARVAMEMARGTADAQSALATAGVNVNVATKQAEAAVAMAQGEATVTETMGNAEAAKITAIGRANAGAVEALGKAQAAGFVAQAQALGKEGTAMVASLHEIGSGGIQITPQVQVSGSGSSGGDGVAATVTALLASQLTIGSKSANNSMPTPKDPLVALDGDAVGSH